GQARLNDASVLMVGAGGLGCPTLLYLAAAGIGRIGICDGDVVEESNLHRQVLFTQDQIGQNKARAARKQLLAHNPAINIEAHEYAVDSKNVEDLFSRYDVIIDGTDNFATKFLLGDAAVKFSKPLVYAALSGFEGQVSVFDAQRGPCYRCLFPQPPTQEIL